MARPVQPSPQVSSRSVAEEMRKIRLSAALRGSFNPIELLRQTGGKGEAQTGLLDALAEICIDRSSASQLAWRLKPDVRRTVLMEASESGELQPALDKLPQKSTDDVFGDMLRKSLRGTTLAIETLSTSDLDELHTAVQFASTVRPTPAKAAEVEAELTRRDADAALEFVKPKRLVGRGPAMRKLREFIRPHPERSSIVPELLMVSGVGGAGKSALLASFVQEVRGTNWAGPPVIWFDFDRALLSRVEPLTLMIELSRQLALARPAMGESLAAFRAEARARMASTTDSADYESNAALESEIWSRWDQIMLGFLPIQEPVILIFDTFEEVLLREESEVRQLLRWIDALELEGKFTDLKPILSGRELQTEDTENLNNRLYGEIALRDLSRRSANSLLKFRLRREGKDPAKYPTLELVERFGGNPLLIKLLARFCSESGPDEARAALEASADPKFEKTFAQSFLYRRIVNRIRTDDPDLTKIAHPGLTLRRVSPLLIQQVLSEPCKLPGMTFERAEELFKKLSRQVWLVERLPGQKAVRHRPDLRRLMLQSMQASEAKAVSEIHFLASEFYKDRRDPEMDDRGQWVEERYHAAFLWDVELTPLEAKRLVRSLGQDIGDLPLERRARIKLAAGRPLSSNELSTLDVGQRAKVKAEKRRIAFEHGEKLSDVEPVAREAGLLRKADLALAVASDFAAGRFGRLGSLAREVVRDFETQVAAGAMHRSSFTYSPMWQMALVGLLDSHVRSELADELSELGPHLAWKRPYGGSTRSTFRYGDAATCVLLLLQRALPPWLVEVAATFDSNAVSSLDELRFLQLASSRLRADLGPVSRIRTSLLNYSSPAVGAELARAQAASSKALGSMFEKLHGAGQISLSDLKELELRLPWVELEPVERQLQLDIFYSRSTELYPLVRSALQSLSIESVITVAQKVQAECRTWPNELVAHQLEGRLQRDRERWTSTLIETADLLGGFRSLVFVIQEAADDSDVDTPLFALSRHFFEAIQHWSG